MIDASLDTSSIEFDCAKIRVNNFPAQMSFRPRTLLNLLRWLAFSLTLLSLCAPVALAQTDSSFGDAEADPVKLFERGQDAHARGDLKLALECYEEAIKLRPEFPEAEFQRGAALVSLGRQAEAESAYRRAGELRAEWALPRAVLGALLAHKTGRERDAEPLLRRALELDASNTIALAALADLRHRAGAAQEAIELLRRATESKDATASLWVKRAEAERAGGDQAAALASLKRALSIDSGDGSARLMRAELFLATKNNELALEDLRAIRIKPVERSTLIPELAKLYARAGRTDEALQTLDQLSEEDKQRPEVMALRTAIAADESDTPEARAALLKLLERDPRNASLLARLGRLYRTSDPQRSLQYFARASEVEPRNVEYATGYASALVQARRFADAAVILRRILEVTPEDYTAHANLATALYELKRFADALPEYEWLIKARPDLSVTYYFIATAHDFLGEYPEALAAYEIFMARADAQKNQLEMEKVNLRLPGLRNQIKHGEGVKRKKQVEEE
jgi:tetratricopeptide (TPR) repeat protein